MVVEERLHLQKVDSEPWGGAPGGDRAQEASGMEEAFLYGQEVFLIFFRGGNGGAWLCYILLLIKYFMSKKDMKHFLWLSIMERYVN